MNGYDETPAIQLDRRLGSCLKYKSSIIMKVCYTARMCHCGLIVLFSPPDLDSTPFLPCLPEHLAFL